MFKRKYRIKQYPGGYFPQKKSWFWFWRFFDRITQGGTIVRIKFEHLVDAQQFLDIVHEMTLPIKTTIHPYDPTISH